MITSESSSGARAVHTPTAAATVTVAKSRARRPRAESEVTAAIMHPGERTMATSAATSAGRPPPLACIRYITAEPNDSTPATAAKRRKGVRGAGATTRGTPTLTMPARSPMHMIVRPIDSSKGPPGHALFVVRPTIARGGDRGSCEGCQSSCAARRSRTDGDRRVPVTPRRSRGRATPRGVRAPGVRGLRGRRRRRGE